MNAAQLHLMTVHVPVLGAGLAAVLLAVGVWRRNLLVEQLALFGLVVSALGAVTAYLSGPGAYEILDAGYVVDKALIEHHAVLGKAAFVGMAVLGVAAVTALLQHAQGEAPPRALNFVLVGGGLCLGWLLAWTAHEGGSIRHPEIRGALPIFPEGPTATPRPDEGAPRSDAPAP